MFTDPFCGNLTNFTNGLGINNLSWQICGENHSLYYCTQALDKQRATTIAQVLANELKIGMGRESVIGVSGIRVIIWNKSQFAEALEIYQQTEEMLKKMKNLALINSTQ